MTLAIPMYKNKSDTIIMHFAAIYSSCNTFLIKSCWHNGYVCYLKLNYNLIKIIRQFKSRCIHVSRGLGPIYLVQLFRGKFISALAVHQQWNESCKSTSRGTTPLTANYAPRYKSTMVRSAIFVQNACKLNI